MGEFMLYLVKAAICLAVFSLFFRLLLMKETFFRFTRFMLLMGLVVCSIIPLVKIGIKHSSMFQKPVNQLEKMFIPSGNHVESGLLGMDEKKGAYDEAVLAATSLGSTRLQPDGVPAKHDATTTALASVEKQIAGREKKMGWENNIPVVTILFAIYLLGVLAMSVRLAMSLLRLRPLIRNNRVTLKDGYRLIICQEPVTPFSYFNYIVLSEADYRSNAKEIILHEQMHIKYRHHLDLLFSELFLIVHWFNPAVWSLYDDLREVHEYEADNAVIEQGIDARDYQLLLVKKAVGEKRFTAVVNSFNQSKIKNRIAMMLRKESKAWARLKLLFVVPLTAVLLLAFAEPKNDLNQIGVEKTLGEAAEFFLSVKKNQKDNYLAYLYLNTEKQLTFVSGNADIASFKVFDLNEKTEITKTLTDLMEKTMRKSASTGLEFILGAEDETKMKNVSSVKYALREAYIKSCESAANKKKMSSEEIKGKFPLSITYTIVQASSPGNILKQVQDNPFFYWDEVQQYCKGKGVQPADLKIESETNRNRRVIMLINSQNQIMYRSHASSEVIKNPEEGNSIVSEQALKKIITEVMKSNDPEPLYYFFQYDESTSTRFLFNFLDSTLPAAYEAALEEVSERDGIDIERLRKEKPLLLFQITPKDTKENANQKNSQKDPNSRIAFVRSSIVKNAAGKRILVSNYAFSKYKGDILCITNNQEYIPNQSGNDSIRQGLVTNKSALDHTDIAIVAMEANVTPSDIETIKKNLFDVKKAIYMMIIR